MGDNGKHVETTGDKDRQEGRQGETRLREGGHTIQHRHTCGDNGRQFGNKTSGRRTHHPTQVHTCGETMGENGEQWGDQGRQDLEKAGTPLKQGNDGRRQGETRPCEGGHTIQHKRILWGDNRRQAETRPREGRRTIQHRHMWGDSGRQWQTRERPEKADIPSEAHMWGDNGRQKGKTTRREGRPTIQHRQRCGETMRDNALNGTEGVRRGDETLGRRTRHPTQAHMWGDNERQDVRKADAPSNTDTHVGRQWETLGDKGERQDIENANTSSNTGTHVGTRQRGKSGDKVPGRRTRQPTKRKGDIGWETKGDKTKADTSRMR